MLYYMAKGTLDLYLWTSEYIYIYIGWTQCITWALKSGRGRQSRQSERRRGRGRRYLSMREIPLAVVGFEDGERGPHTKECGWPLESVNNPQLTANRETQVSILSLRGTAFC